MGRGVDCKLEKKKLVLEKDSSDKLKDFDFDATDCPDFFLLWLHWLLFAKDLVLLKESSRLAHKESDRAITLQEEFGKLGVEILFMGI